MLYSLLEVDDNQMILLGIVFPFTVGLKVSEIPVRKVHLTNNGLSESPWCYVADSSSVGSSNFLATQVWPASRVASDMICKHLPALQINKRKVGEEGTVFTMCELGCGPGLPSLTAAARTKPISVISTDIDGTALKMVKLAGEHQNLDNLSTQIFDMTDNTLTLPSADLYVLSDVFENNAVARGAAKFTHDALSRGKYVWVFAQYDRAQRDTFVEELTLLMKDESPIFSLSWDSQFRDELLWLCDVDENNVSYN